MDALAQVVPFITSPFSGYVYPNETVLPWGVLVVIYPYITGLVAGAFIVSSLYHTFRMEQFKPVARLALLSALAFLCFAPLALLSHLGIRSRLSRQSGRRTGPRRLRRSRMWRGSTQSC